MPLKCPTQLLFGISCPTCGLGRSLIAAINGEYDLSFSYHPFGIPLFFGLSVGCLVTIFTRETTQARLNAIYLFWLDKWKIMIYFAVGLYCIWGIFIRDTLKRSLLTK